MLQSYKPSLGVCLKAPHRNFGSFISKHAKASMSYHLTTGALRSSSKTTTVDADQPNISRGGRTYPKFIGFGTKPNPRVNHKWGPIHSGSDFSKDLYNYQGVSSQESTNIGAVNTSSPSSPIISPGRKIVRASPQHHANVFKGHDPRIPERPSHFTKHQSHDHDDNYGEFRNERFKREDNIDAAESDRFNRGFAKKPTPARFTALDNHSINTPELSFDSQYKKRVVAKNKEKQRNRRFESDGSAILEEQVHSGRKQSRKSKKELHQARPIETRPVFLPQFVSLENLASILNIRVDEFMKQLIHMGFTCTHNDHVIDADTAGLIAGEYGYESVIDKSDSMDLKPRPPAFDKSILPPRPPVVTIMGHVDHGKTTLLDWLRKSSIVDSEHGGITQHIGAFSVSMPSGKTITFLDTPGHAAFLTMRERGANVTDIVILVVAADDSVMPQTIEAIKHTKSAGVPMIVAINKVDKDGTDIQKVKGDLARHGVNVEDYGGDTQCVCVSGKTGQGLGDLEEATNTLGEILDHRAEPDGQCQGWILEATTTKRGRVATVLITRGTLKPGDIIVAGRTWTKVRTLSNENGENVLSASPSTPVVIDGWKDQPDAGELALQAESEERAKSAVSYRTEKFQRIQQAVDMEAINETRRQQREKEQGEERIRKAAISRGDNPTTALLQAARDIQDIQPKIQEVRFLVKADVAGSVEAVVGSVADIGNEEVRSKVVRSAFGSVSESDVDHAAATRAYILAFNLPTDPMIYQYARAKNVSIIAHNIIYHLVDDVKLKMSEYLAPKIIPNVTGEAEILKVFNIKIRGRVFKSVAGCRVKNGLITRNSKVRVIRDKNVVFDGTLESLKNVKKDVTEMKKGSDCGIGFDGWYEFQEGDQVQCYEVREEPRTL